IRDQTRKCAAEFLFEKLLIAGAGLSNVFVWPRIAKQRVITRHHLFPPSVLFFIVNPLPEFFEIYSILCGKHDLKCARRNMAQIPSAGALINQGAVRLEKVPFKTTANALARRTLEVDDCVARTPKHSLPFFFGRQPSLMEIPDLIVTHFRNQTGNKMSLSIVLVKIFVIAGHIGELAFQPISQQIKICINRMLAESKWIHARSNKGTVILGVIREPR